MYNLTNYKTMKKLTSTTLIACALLFGFSCNQKKEPVEEAQEANEQAFEDTPMEETKDDVSEFMTEAASGGMMEVELGRIAQQKAQHADVKSFAQMMVTDHTKANDELKALAGTKNIVLPDSMSKDHMDHINNLRDKTGADFDNAYMDLMVDDHEDDVKEFDEAAQNLQDPEVKAFASKTVVTLRKHLDRAKQINDMLDKQKK
jgi:putative membrane protein